VPGVRQTAGSNQLLKRVDDHTPDVQMSQLSTPSRAYPSKWSRRASGPRGEEYVLVYDAVRVSEQ
jgi:hypothetical protein